jgi:multiple sugar transport system ATP-binding protein
VAARLGSPRINLMPRAALGQWPAPAGAASLGVRAEHLLVHAADQAVGPTLAAQVRRIEILSDQRLVHLALAEGGHEVVSAAFSEAGLEPGAQVRVQMRRVLWFDAEGQRVAAVSAAA